MPNSNSERVKVGRFKKGIDMSNSVEGIFSYSCQLNMIDDTKNRLISGDRVVVTGVYRYSAGAIFDCTYELVE